MSHQLSEMLNIWWSGRDETEWVLGTVYRTEGSAYRKAGAMMLIDGHGQQHGLLSGGCLEADIVRNARKAMVMGKVVMLEYDGNDEDDVFFKLGVGCGGKVYIMLQPLSADNDLGLGELRHALHARQTGYYRQKVGECVASFSSDENVLPGQQVARLMPDEKGNDWLVTPIRPEPHILIVGGGLDARPVVNIAHEMGWKVSLADPRPANARPEHFPNVSNIVRDVASLGVYANERRVDAVVLMAHSVSIDADALKAISASNIRHVSALGPRHRFANVLDHAGLREHALPFPVSSPAGLDIGGQLPESIALSMLSGIHQALYKQTSSRLAQAAE
ncbi:XdhC family protein [Thalassospira lucentensis]|uniref:XdhC family protein n=1 Tax=Thalassospira lucentensis TaxID=168935 RepID=UPI00142DC6D0|nr:XdhC family protein [Thalassospira lucentensis]NIZ03317.1 XdhC family protein [Thalassospira lucentensis]